MPLGEPMAIIEAPPRASHQEPTQASYRSRPQSGPPASTRCRPPPGGPPSPRPDRVCPKCDSHAAKRVFRNGTELYPGLPGLRPRVALPGEPAMSRNNKNTKQILISLPVVWINEIYRLAEEETRTLSKQVQHMLKPQLSHIKKPDIQDE